jgi:chemotaxis response regulator CheB
LQKKTKQETISVSSQNDNLFVVGIGASAGGVEAFTKMIHEIPLGNYQHDKINGFSVRCLKD